MLLKPALALMCIVSLLRFVSSFWLGPSTHLDTVVHNPYMHQLFLFQ